VRIPSVDAVAVENGLNLSFCDGAVLILVDCFESFPYIKSFVTEQGLSESFNLTLLIQNVFYETKEHHVLNTALLLLLLTLGFVCLILLLFSLAFFFVLLFELQSLLLPTFTLFLNLLFPP
jgi:hypothetical protein